MSIFFFIIFKIEASVTIAGCMKISSSFYKQDRNINSPSFQGVPPNPKFIPEFIGTLGKYAGEYIDSPEQRLFLGLATIAFKPLIDLKYAEKDKKADTAIKSAAKGIAGMTTGIAIRSGFIKLTEKYIGYDFIKDKAIRKSNMINTLFLPDIAKEMCNESIETLKRQTKKYCNTLGSILAIIFMIVFSNSKIDVPLTNDLHDLLAGVIKDNKSWPKSIYDTIKARGGKIVGWFKKKKDAIVNIKNKVTDIAAVIKTPDDKQKKNGVE